jgi:hypothetical protein
LGLGSVSRTEYGQRDVDMGTEDTKFSEYLNDELSGKSDLAVPVGGLADLIK